MADGLDWEIDLESLVTFRISRLADTLTRAAAQVYGKRFGLTLTEWRTLAILARHGPTTANEISRRSRIDKGWISRSVAGLEGRGLVGRRPNPGDSRSFMLHLTEDGRRLVARVAPVSLARHERLLAGLDAETRRTLLGLLDRIQAQADRMLDDPGEGEGTAP